MPCCKLQLVEHEPSRNHHLYFYSHSVGLFACACAGFPRFFPSVPPLFGPRDLWRWFEVAGDYWPDRFVTPFSSVRSFGIETKEEHGPTNSRRDPSSSAPRFFVFIPRLFPPLLSFFFFSSVSSINSTLPLIVGGFPDRADETNEPEKFCWSEWPQCDSLSFLCRLRLFVGVLGTVSSQMAIILRGNS